MLCDALFTDYYLFIYFKTLSGTGRKPVYNIPTGTMFIRIETFIMKPINTKPSN